MSESEGQTGGGDFVVNGQTYRRSMRTLGVTLRRLEYQHGLCELVPHQPLGPFRRFAAEGEIESGEIGVLGAGVKMRRNLRVSIRETPAGPEGADSDEGSPRYGRDIVACISYDFGDSRMGSDEGLWIEVSMPTAVFDLVLADHETKRLDALHLRVEFALWLHLADCYGAEPWDSVQHYLRPEGGASDSRHAEMVWGRAIAVTLSRSRVILRGVPNQWEAAFEQAFPQTPSPPQALAPAIHVTAMDDTTLSAVRRVTDAVRIAAWVVCAAAGAVIWRALA